MKRKITLKKNSLIVLSSLLVLGAMSFAPMFMGPGLTVASIDAFVPFTDTTFPANGIATDPYEVAYENLEFDTPLNFNTVPGQARIVVGQRDGQVFWFDDDDAATQSSPVIDMSTEVGGGVWDGGFLGLSIHPDFGTVPGKNYFYVYYTSQSSDTFLEESRSFSCGQEWFHGNYLFLERFEVDPVTMLSVPGTKEVMIRRQMYNTTHRGGGMDFGNDGFLYISTGDQAAYVNAQDISENLDGGVLRIDVDMIGGTTSHAPIRTLSSPGAGEADEISGNFYFIPNTNPFNDPSGAVFEEYFSLGHRNPHRMTKDRVTGTFYIGEVGENTHEEINVLSAGSNYGWPLFEATAPRSFNNLATGQPCVTQLLNGMPHQPPLVEFQRSEASAIIGGYVYRGSEITALQGRYICADYGVGNEIWEVDPTNGNKTQWGSFTPGNPVSFGQDYDGELYILSEGTNVNLYRLTESTNLGAAPATLTATGAFDDIQTLDVADGFIPYDMIDPFWSDGAYKKRWIAIPNDGTYDTAEEQIEFSENGVWGFPNGTIIIKHFDFPIDDNNPLVTQKVETRFSIKGNDGVFYFLTYQWNAAETEATLVNGGLDRVLNVAAAGGGTRNVTWHYPSTSECLTCHNEISEGTLGLRTRYLNKDYDYSTHEATGTLGNQLVTLSSLGVLDQTITDTDTPTYLTHTSIDEIGADIDDQARSYLDLNCAYCHQAGSATAGRASFDLRLFNTLAQTGLLTSSNNESIGLGADERIVFAGNAQNSQLFHRTNSTTQGIMMPPLAKDQVDEQGAELLRIWINQLQAPAVAPALGTYRIVNTETLETLQVASTSNRTMTNVQQVGYQGLAHQHWVLEPAVDAGYYRLRAANGNRYLDVAGFGDGAGVNAWQWEDDPSDAQEWEVVDAGNGTFSLVVRRSGNFLGVEADGNAAVAPNNGTDIFRWEFQAVGPPVNRAINTSAAIVTTDEAGAFVDVAITLGTQPTDDVVIDVVEVEAEDEFSISLAQLTFTNANWNVAQTLTITGEDDADADGAQPFALTLKANVTSLDINYIGVTNRIDGVNSDDDGGGVAPPEPGIYRIVNTQSGLTAEVLAGNIDDEINVQQGASYQAADNEHFELVFEGNSMYSLLAVHSGKALDVALSGATAGTNVWQYEANGTNAQLWTIEDAGNGTYHIISDLNGFYLGIDAEGNIEVNTDDTTDIYRWEFFYQQEHQTMLELLQHRLYFTQMNREMLQILRLF